METLWFYSPSDSPDKRGPVSERELRDLLAKGQVKPTDLAWRDGMQDWKPISSIDELKVEEVSQQSPELSADNSSIVQTVIRWMTFVGIASIVAGITNIVSCFPLVQGILQILAGLALLSARGSLSGMRIDASTESFLTKLKSFLLLTGIAYVMIILTFFIAVVILVSGFSSGTPPQ